MAIPAIMSSHEVSADELNTNPDMGAEDEDEEHHHHGSAAGPPLQPEEQAAEEQDRHQQDLVMPGFRFHPTEEELVEFYLRRKVEGKRFQVELITFLDLYRYDPWELPAMAAIGEKEWYFYVPRDRKYRNGDRPNRVTASGYWKATGADRMIRSDNNFRSIGLKKTLVFYSGKAPKGIRTSWIMNEYRLPQHETQRLHPNAEISLCRVYKRAGVVDDHHQPLPRALASRPSSSSSSSYNHRKQTAAAASVHGFPTNLVGSSSSSSLQFESRHNYQQPPPPPPPPQMGSASDNMEQMSETEGSSSGTVDIAPLGGISQPQHFTVTDTAANYTAVAGNGLFSGGSGSGGGSPPPASSNAVLLFDDLQRLINYQHAAAAAAAASNCNPVINVNHPLQQQQYYPHDYDNMASHMTPPQPAQQQFWPPVLQFSQSLGAAAAPPSDRLWEWNPESNRSASDYATHPFK